MIEVDNIPNNVCNGEYKLIDNNIVKVGYTKQS